MRPRSVRRRFFHVGWCGHRDVYARRTPYLVDDKPGSAGVGSNVFWIWGGACVACFIFTFFFIYETKGLALEQVDILYRNSNALHSNKFRKQILDENLHDEDKEAYYAGAQKNPIERASTRRTPSCATFKTRTLPYSLGSRPFRLLHRVLMYSLFPI
ncbi:hypothetical protein NBRC10513_006986 [Rhodotorula toruloides]|uniref:MFS monosaccharide transporter n=1 Tax=Rhodotorula toruloides TaxID=5286 RepID=A0A2T0AET8_RHOTO|nr:hypothetical protein AAT19DRAFT_11922 [Rhodotorula toruloides]